MKIIIKIVKDDISILKEVINLAKENSATLGFLPKGAFFHYAEKGQLVCAFNEKEKLIGYLLYSINIRGKFIYVVHLCVDNNYRFKGVSRYLFDELVKNTKNDYRGVRVRCRRDYEATNLWPKLGFKAIDDRPGRSKQGSVLTVWWYDYDHPDLFSQSNEQLEASKIDVVIDSSIFFELNDTRLEGDNESKVLLGDWLQDNIELCVTRELFNDINKNKNLLERSKLWKHARTFKEIKCIHSEFEIIRKELQEKIIQAKTEQDKSDIRQLALTIGSQIEYFITKDDTLLRKEEEIYNRFGIHVLRPSVFIINLDELLRENEYKPVRITGPNLFARRISRDNVKVIEDKFLAYRDERKSQFRKILHEHLSNPIENEALTISYFNDDIAFVLFDSVNENILRIPLLRVIGGKLSTTISRYLVNHAIIKAVNENISIIVLDDKYTNDSVEGALYEYGFMRISHNKWFRIVIRGVGSINNAILYLNRIKKDYDEFKEKIEYLVNSLQLAKKNGNWSDILKIEQSLWPLKFSDLRIDSYIIPIKPQWAMHLIDPSIEKQDLFGGLPNLLLNIENAYYRSSKPYRLTAPSRILWYVSKGNSKYQDVMSIKACSYIQEIAVDKPKIVYSRYKRFGIYTWKNVYAIAKNIKNNDIMAFRFSRTEIFNRPIEIGKIREIWDKEDGKNFNPICPVKISTNRFLKLYKMGVSRE